MKVLSLDIHFHLPDDFVGDANDALQHLINYRREQGLTNFKHNVAEPAASIWEGFLSAVPDGYRLYGKAGVNEYDGDSQTWRVLG